MTSLIDTRCTQSKILNNQSEILNNQSQILNMQSQILKKIEPPVILDNVPENRIAEHGIRRCGNVSEVLYTPSNKRTRSPSPASQASRRRRTHPRVEDRPTSCKENFAQGPATSNIDISANGQKECVKPMKTSRGRTKQSKDRTKATLKDTENVHIDIDTAHHDHVPDNMSNCLDTGIALDCHTMVQSTIFVWKNVSLR